MVRSQDGRGTGLGDHFLFYKFIERTHGALQCSCYFSKGHQRAVCSSLWKTLKEIQLVNPKGNQSWIFIGRTDAGAKTPILCSPDVKNWLIGKDPNAGKDWGQEEKGTTEDEMVGWHLWLNGHGFGWTPGVGDGQGGLVCCGSWGCKESDMSLQLNKCWM